MGISQAAQQFRQRLAVCSWSLQPKSPAELIQHLHAIGLTHIQLDLDPFREQPAIWETAPALFARHGITLRLDVLRDKRRTLVPGAPVRLGPVAPVVRDLEAAIASLEEWLQPQSRRKAA